MSFSDHKITAFQHKITDLPDQPTLSPQELKARFDSSPEELRKAVIDILMVNAMIHTAAVSPMTAAEFHDKMEGLGMLMSLPVDFTVQDVEKMMTALEGLAG